MPAWFASVTADVSTLAAAWNSLRGGWPAAWRDAEQLLSQRRTVIDTEAQTRGGLRVVLRTRVRLNGDVQTDILRCWLDGTPHRSAEALLNTHFQSVGDATKGWSAVSAGIRLASLLTVASGMIPGGAFAIRLAFREEWQTLVSALLTNWCVLSSLGIVAIGFLLRGILRLWLQRKFRAWRLAQR
jgi:hypothetical protein